MCRRASCNQGRAAALSSTRVDGRRLRSAQACCTSIQSSEYLGSRSRSSQAVQCSVIDNHDQKVAQPHTRYMPSAAPLKMTRVLSSLRHLPLHVAELALTASRRRRRLGRARPLPRTVGVAPPHGPRHSDRRRQDDLVHRPCAAARNSKSGYARLTQNTQGGMLIWGLGGGAHRRRLPPGQTCRSTPPRPPHAAWRR